MSKEFMVGVDVGGTFTDGVAVDSAGNVRLAKVPTTPANQAEGVAAVLEALAVAPGDLEVLVHGTTAGTNALLERKGAVTGLVTTAGFRDILELGRRERPQLYGMFGAAEPLITRERRLEATERVGADGGVVLPLDEDELRRALHELLALGTESLLIGFLHSYANRAHEERARAIATEIWPNAYITTSSEIVAEFREFERFGTAAINAYLQPVIDRYVGALADRLRRDGYDRELIIMQANGGMMTADVARRQSVNTVLSGPAAGVIASKALGELAGIDNIISCDLGGTSFDVGMVVAGQPLVTSDRDLDYNVPLRIPTIDIRTIGAGGGSIARVNAGGLLQVGPDSAGARPGPIAYGRGGDEPTVTDANVVLGRLPTTGLTGVDVDVDVEFLQQRMRKLIGEPLGLSVTDAAAAILRVVNDKMAATIRLVSLQRGFDPRDFTLLGFGGAGPLHAVELARELNIPKVLIPHSPGILAAIGCLVARVRQDFVQTVSRRLDSVEDGELAGLLRRHRDNGRAALVRQGVSETTIVTTHIAEMQYEGQTHSVYLPLDTDEPSAASLASTLAGAYRERYGVDLDGYSPRLVNIRTVVEGDRGALDLRRLVSDGRRAQGSLSDARLGERPVYFDGAWHDTPVYHRHRIPGQATLTGPAILAQADSTVVIPPRCRATTDALGNLLIDVEVAK